MGNRKHKAYLKSQYKKSHTKNDNELHGCRELHCCRLAYWSFNDIIVIARQSWTKVGQSKAWKSRAEESHSGPALRYYYDITEEAVQPYIIITMFTALLHVKNKYEMQNIPQFQNVSVKVHQSRLKERPSLRCLVKDL